MRSGTVDAVPYREGCNSRRCFQDGIRDRSNWIPSPPTVRCKRSGLVSCGRAIVRRRGRGRGRDRVRDILISHGLHEGALDDSLTSASQTIILKRRQRSASYPWGESRRLRQRSRATFDIKDHHRMAHTTHRTQCCPRRQSSINRERAT